ncbi:MAG: alpha/beta hydrolase [Alphaproteobacteria bacterium]|nr:MAG: alpha/beta hydrolase [Alphaproteobacteria bacterium]
MSEKSQVGMPQADPMRVEDDGAVRRRRTPPAGARFDWMERPDGVRVRVALWDARGDDRRGTVVILHGWREFIEKYFETVADLLDRGFGVATMDWRGQGLSSRPLADRHKGHAASFDANVDDVRALMTMVQDALPGPYFLMAHSFGGHCALRYLHDEPGMVERAVLLAPMIGIDLHGFPEAMARGLVAVARWFRFDRAYALFQGQYSEEARRRQASLLTSDPERFEDEIAAYRANPELALGGVTYGWLGAAFDSIDKLRAPGFAEAITTRLMVVLAGCERVVDNRAAKRFCRRLPNARIVEITGARHEILRERDELREQFWAAFDEFMDRAGV